MKVYISYWFYWVMRVRYSFSSRKTRTLDRDNKHRKQFSDVVKQLIDKSEVILEVLDARFLDETRNPQTESYISEQGKKIIFVLNKVDLVNYRLLKKQLEEKGIYPYVLVSSRERKGVRELRDRIKIEAGKIKGFSKINVGVIGYPNTGKSSVINLLVGKHVARVASEAGYTKGIQKIKLSESIFIIDTPGVIESSEYSMNEQKKMTKHAILGARTWDKVKAPESVVHDLMAENPGLLEKFYDIEVEGDSEKLIEELGRRHHFLLSGNRIDSDRTCRLILKDWQFGKIRKD